MTIRRDSNANAAQARLQMADIARLAGVSVATVSRALNQSSLVNEATRIRIEELARSLNYTINIGAKNLRLGQNRTIAVVVPYDPATRQHVSDPFFLSMLGSIADAITDKGYDMLLSRVDADRLDLAARVYDTGQAMGIILIGQWCHHDQLNEMALRHVPLAVWGAQLPQQLYCTVGCDNVLGGALATEHLIAGGRRRIAFFGDRNLPEVAQRFDGYKNALHKHKISLDESLIVPATFVAESARVAVRTLCKQKIDFDAIFACSDLLAMTSIGTLREQGLQVPDDVSVVGYDDIELAYHFNPPLTTVRQPIERGGHALVEALLGILEGARPQPYLLPTELIVRATGGLAARPAVVAKSRIRRESAA